MKRFQTSFVAILLSSCVYLAGCGGKSVDGTWSVSGFTNAPVGASALVTFGPGESMKFEIDSASPTGQGRLKMTITGTYALKGDVLSATAKDIALSSEGVPDQIKAMIESQFNAQAKEKLIEDFNKDNKGSNITWVDDKTFKAKEEKGEVTFTKQ